MQKIIYLVYDIPAEGIGDWYETDATFDRDEAIRAASGNWSHLTENEQKKRKVYVGVHSVEVPDDDQRTADQIYSEMIHEDTWNPDHDVIEINCKKMKVQFEAGNGNHFPSSVNYLISKDHSLYAECQVPEGASDDYGYLTMKAALVEAYKARGGDPADLEFWYDGQERFLEDDASAECEVYTEVTEVDL